MGDQLASDVIGAENHLRSQRTEFDAMWREIAAQIDPLSDFNGTGTAAERGYSRLSKIFNTRPVLALERAASAAQSLLVPAGDKWHDIKPINEELIDNEEARRYTETLRQRLFSWRYDPKGGFQSAIGPSFRELIAYGTHAIHVEEQFGGDAPFLYRFVPLSQFVHSVNSAGIEDTVYRKFPMTAKQMAQKFGEGRLAEAVKTALDDPKLRGEKYFTVIHAVYPRTSDKSRFSFESVYVDADNRVVLSQGGNYEQPYVISTLGRASDRLPYGYSPGLRALADVKGAHHARRLFLRAAEKAIDPPIGVTNDYEGTLNINAGAIVRGMYAPNGSQLMGSLALGGNPNLGADVFEMFNSDVNANFYLDLFSAIMNKQNMTATEVLGIMEERSNYLSPAFENQEAMLGRIVGREISILNRKAENGEITLPPMPPILRDNGGVNLEFSSPLAQLRRAKQAQANMQAVRAVGEIAQLDPTVLDTVNLDEAAYEAASAFGASASIWRDRKAVADIRENRAAQAQAQQQLDQQSQQAQQVAALTPTLQMIRDSQNAQPGPATRGPNR